MEASAARLPRPADLGLAAEDTVRHSLAEQYSLDADLRN
jgi:hypothetical protein